jgi:small GTP-binding protein
MTGARWWWCTAPAPGAIAVACVHGACDALDQFARALTGRGAPAVGRTAWRTLASVDDGVLARPVEGTLLVMPHGGPRLRARLALAFTAAGAAEEAASAAAWDATDAGDSRRTAATAAGATAALARATFPESADDIEALALATLASAASPAAVDLLLAQPGRWRAAREAGTPPPDGTDARHAALAHLLRPARVVVTGPANAGKSTLLNRLAGRAVAVVHAEPGTTRDAVAARLDLDGIVVDWFDTPGVRPEADAIEEEATRVARGIMAHADLVVHLSAPGLGWSGLPAGRAPVLRVLNKSDTSACASCMEREHAELAISAAHGSGAPDLVRRVRDALVPPRALAAPDPWRFHAALPRA